MQRKGNNKAYFAITGIGEKLIQDIVFQTFFINT